MAGRLHIGTAFGAASLVVLAIVAGLVAGTDLTGLTQDEVRAQAWEELSFQNSSWVDAFYGSVQTLRTQAQLQVQSKPTGGLLHIVQFQLKDGKAAPVRTQRAETVTLAQESEWLREAQSRATQWGPTLRGAAFGILRFRPDLASTHEWLGVLFREGAEIYAVAAQAPQIFPYLSRYVARAAGGTRRAYLVGLDGTVLAHSQESYVGTNLKGIPIFDQALNLAAQGTRKNGVGEFESVERLPIWAAYQRIGTLPLIAVTEQVPPPKKLLAVGWQSTVGKLLLTLGVLLFAAVALSFAPAQALQGASQSRAARNLAGPTGSPSDPLSTLFDAPALPAGVQYSGASAAGPGLTQVGQKLLESPAPAAPAYPETLGFGETMLRDDLRASQETLRALEEERKVLTEVEEGLWKTQDPEQANQRMTQGVSRLCGSPTLFFQYQETLRTATLKYDAGFASGHAPVELAFPIDTHTLERLTGLALQEGNEARNEAKSILSENAAMARIILARTGVAHFEAWPVFRYSALGRAAGKPRLHGVLIILQAGEAAYTRGDSIGRMIRSATLVYENTLHSQ